MALLARFRYFYGYYTSIRTGKRVGDKKWVMPKLFNLIIFKVWCITLSYDAIYKYWVDLFIKT